MYQKLILSITLTIMMLASSLSPSFAKASITKDISYGNLERQKYDLYLPKTIDDQTPVLFFIYGGSWESGDKDSYAFIGKTFSKEGFITAIPDYRLYPKVIFPSFVEDAALAFAKVRAKYPNRKIFISGHSAGAQIGSLLTLDDKYLNKHALSPCGSISGFIGLAGPYDFEVTEDKFKRIFPADIRPQSQAINFANKKAPPSLLLHGRSDYTVHPEDSEILAKRLKASGNSSEVKIYNRVGHINIVAGLHPLMLIAAPTKKDMIKFMNSNTQKAPSC